MQSITTAVVPVGGLGTRFLPAMKSGLKCLLPVYNRTVLDYLVDNCLEAGIQKILLVPSKHFLAIEHYVSEDRALRKELIHRGKHSLCELIVPLRSKIDIQFVAQPDGTPTGTAAALACVRDHIRPRESFVVMMGDDFLWRRGGESDLRDMIMAYEKTGATAGCMVSRARTFAEIRHNAVVTTRGKRAPYYLDNIIEKPPEDEGSRFSSIGRYIFDTGVFDVIRKQPPDPRSNEIHLSDTLRLLSKQGPVLVHVMKGRHLDCGVPERWLATNNFIARLRTSSSVTLSDPAPAGMGKF